MKKLIAALILFVTFPSFANEHWPSKELTEPRYWKTYTSDFTGKFARACTNDYKHLPKSKRDTICVCVIWSVENYISFTDLKSLTDDGRRDVLEAAQATCEEIANSK